MKHTPGPWEIKNVPSAGIGIFAKVDIGKSDMSNGVLQPIYNVSVKPMLQVQDDGMVVAQLCYESWRQFPSTNFKEMQEANARLIASAPELLKALKRFVESSPCSNGCKKDDMTCDTQFAKYVIAKAEGK